MAQPANTISSLAFVVVGVAIAMLALRGRGSRSRSLVFAGCLVGTGLGSVAYHGPQTPGAELVHDLSIVFVLAFVALLDLSLLVPRFRAVLPGLLVFAIGMTGAAAFVPVLAAPSADALVVIVIVEEVLVYQRSLRPHPKLEQQRLLLTMTIVLVIAGGMFFLGRTDGAMCHPTSLVQPHAGWHVAAAVIFGVWWWIALAASPNREATDRNAVRSVADVDATTF